VRASVVALSCGVSLCACATAPPPASEAEQTAAFSALHECLLSATTRLDDGMSDATNVAIGVASACGPQFKASEDVSFRQENLQVRAMLAQRSTERRITVATRAVLEVRAARAAAASNPQQPQTTR
jgi:hypothetical protein